jgi:hypothetical protein
VTSRTAQNGPRSQIGGRSVLAFGSLACHGVHMTTQTAPRQYVITYWTKTTEFRTGVSAYAVADQLWRTEHPADATQVYIEATTEDESVDAVKVWFNGAYVGTVTVAPMPVEGTQDTSVPAPVEHEHVTDDVTGDDGTCPVEGCYFGRPAPVESAPVARPFTLSDSVAIEPVMYAATHKCGVRRYIDGEIVSGTARHLVRSPEDFTFSDPRGDVRDAYLRVTLTSGFDVAWLVSDLMNAYGAGEFALDES